MNHKKSHTGLRKLDPFLFLLIHSFPVESRSNLRSQNVVNPVNEFRKIQFWPRFLKPREFWSISEIFFLFLANIMHNSFMGIYSRGDQYWNWANCPPEVAAFSLKKILQSIVHRVAIWRFNIGEFTKRPQKILFFYFHVIHYFLGNLWLNSNLKSV